MTGEILLADMGGTHARFALASSETFGFSQLEVLICEDFPTAELAIMAYLDQVNVSRPARVCLAAAGPVLGGDLRLTNNHWVLERQKLKKLFPESSITLINDFEAVACCVPYLRETDTLELGPSRPVDWSASQMNFAVIGPGTGLGMAGLCKRENRFFAVSGEGGNASFAPETNIQSEILALLDHDDAPVSIEQVLSGPGIMNLYHAICKMQDQDDVIEQPASLFEMAMSNDCRIASETVQLFFEILGQATGNLALTLGATDGVFIGGGILPRYPELLSQSLFRTGFERKGHYQAYMKKIPTQLIIHPQPGLLGALHIALHRQPWQDSLD